MARGFGSTFGSASTDIITTTYAANSSLTSWSVWFWINSGIAAGTFPRIWQKDNTTNNNFTLYYDTDNQRLTFQYTWTGGQGVWYASANLKDSSWHHTLLTYDNTAFANIPVIYIGGVSQSVVIPVGVTGTPATNSDPYTIGNRAAGGRNWDGKIADFAIWNVILGAGEAAAFARGARPSRIRPASLVPSWPLDGIQSPEPDLSGGKFNGTLTGTALAAGPPVNMFTPRWPQFLAAAAAPPPTLPPPVTNLLFV